MGFTQNLKQSHSRFKSGTGSLNLGLIFFVIINIVLYPYSRYVYESIIDFIMGNAEMRVNALLFLATKFITMTLCFFFSIFIAPIGLGYLYYRCSKEQDNELDYDDYSR